MADENDQQAHVDELEHTMIYRKPTDDSDETKVSEIWGAMLETKVIPAAEVPALLAQGWVKNPLELEGLGHAPPGFEPAKPKTDKPDDPYAGALAVAEALARELGETVKTLTKERDDALVAAERGAERIAALEADLPAEKQLRAAGAEHIRTLEAEAKAAKAKAKPAT